MRPTHFHWLRLIALSTPLAAQPALAQTPPMPPVQQTGAATQAQPNVAATVNGEIISLKQFQDQENRISAYYSQMLGGQFENLIQKKQLQMELHFFMHNRTGTTI